VLDYREMDSAGQIAGSGPVHISYTGKMISSDLARKWTRWNVKANCADVITREGNEQQMWFGGGNGLALGSGTGFGNAYYLDPAKLTDDDYGEIFSPYTTYFFINHEQEQQLGVGSHRKLFVYLSLYITGTGRVQITPLVDGLTFPWTPTPIYNLSSTINHDLEFGLNVTGERVAFKITPLPMPNQTDKQFNLQKMVVTIKQEPMAPVRGAI
jgi:hypothetical protein